MRVQRIKQPRLPVGWTMVAAALFAAPACNVDFPTLGGLFASAPVSTPPAVEPLPLGIFKSGTYEDAYFQRFAQEGTTITAVMGITVGAGGSIHNIFLRPQELAGVGELLIDFRALGPVRFQVGEERIRLAPLQGVGSVTSGNVNVELSFLETRGLQNALVRYRVSGRLISDRVIDGTLNIDVDAGQDGQITSEIQMVFAR